MAAKERVERTPRARWEHFPHSADVGIRGYAATLPEAFEQAALALTGIVTDAEIEPRTSVEVRGEPSKFRTIDPKRRRCSGNLKACPTCPLMAWLANPVPLGPLALDEPGPIAGPTGSLNCERGMIGWISVALSHDLCAAKRAAHRNQIVTLVQFEHTLCSVALDCWTVVNLSGPVKTFGS